MIIVERVKTKMKTCFISQLATKLRFPLATRTNFDVSFHLRNFSPVNRDEHDEDQETKAKWRNIKFNRLRRARDHANKVCSGEAML